MRTVVARCVYVDGERGKNVRIIDERHGHRSVEVERADLANLIEALRARLPTPPGPDTTRMVIRCDCGVAHAFLFNPIPPGEGGELDRKIDAWKREHARSHEKDGDHDERLFTAELRA